MKNVEIEVWNCIKKNFSVIDKVFHKINNTLLIKKSKEWVNWSLQMKIF